MKRILAVLLTLAMITALFVSCNADGAEESGATKALAYATFDEGTAKGLDSSYAGYPAYNNLYWYYQAVKKDTYGTTGQTPDGYMINVAGNNETGLSGKVGPFSEGDWQFTLRAYKEALTADTPDFTQDIDGTSISVKKYTVPATDNCVYKGETNSISPFINIKRDQTNYIPVTVTPQGATGTITFQDCYYKWQNGNGSKENKLYLTATGTYLAEEGGSSPSAVTFVTKELTWDTTDSRYNITGNLELSGASTTAAIPVGVYTVTFDVRKSADATDNFQEQTISFKVMGGLTNVISGDLIEGLSYENYFVVPELRVATFTSSSSTAKAITVEVVPQNNPTSGSDITTVYFPATSLDTTNTQHSLEVEVESQNVVTNDSNFTASDGQVAVASIDVTLKKIVTSTTAAGTTVTEQSVTSFENGKKVTIATYIEKNLENVKVFYNNVKLGSDDFNTTNTPAAPTPSSEGTVGYNATTGLLVFKTAHFSEWYVTCTCEAVNVTLNNKRYAKLKTAVEEVTDGQEIKLINNATLSADMGNAGYKITKSFTLDLGGKTLTGGIRTGDISDLQPLNMTITDSIGGGKFVKDSAAINAVYLWVPGITINDGEFYTTGCEPLIFLQDEICDGQTALTINGGTFTGVEQGQVVRDEFGTAVINDGTFTAGELGSTITVSEGGSVTINGGTFTGTTMFDMYKGSTTKKSTVNVYGGTFTIIPGTWNGTPITGDLVCVNTGATAGTDVEVNIYGGTFNVDPTAYVPTGYTVTRDESDGAWTVSQNLST